MAKTSSLRMSTLCPPDRPTKPVIAPMIPLPLLLLVEYDHPETADVLGLLGLLGRDGAQPLRVSVCLWLWVCVWLSLPLPNDCAETSLRTYTDYVVMPSGFSREPGCAMGPLRVYMPVEEERAVRVTALHVVYISR
ncbi:hypothetical protein PHLGIDRAFT_25148 [Phlebiopsis gigantea 11061_1 CR5-6]|uniref:Uncharacterized protein n=1 Tax=Phlebiopsis gigantea (strain 11061_1 CR5-6) TaxID=745531 RepID=A0A0C3S515_PHLG1|nr:hypothetical protein PHLGIDRAFT_25148 [Phlebiopsis gigantea 11061_1 CR5-6]